MKKFWKFGDTLVNENNTSELKSRIKEDYTIDDILNVIAEWNSIDDLLESLDNGWEDEDTIKESENQDWYDLIDYDPNEGVNPYKEFPEYPHEI